MEFCLIKEDSLLSCTLNIRLIKITKALGLLSEPAPAESRGPSPGLVLCCRSLQSSLS